MTSKKRKLIVAVSFVLTIMFLCLLIYSDTAPLGECHLIRINGTFTVPKNNATQLMVISGNYCVVTTRYFLLINGTSKSVSECMPCNDVYLHGGDVIYSRNLTVRACNMIRNAYLVTFSFIAFLISEVILLSYLFNEKK